MHEHKNHPDFIKGVEASLANVSISVPPASVLLARAGSSNGLHLQITPPIFGANESGDRIGISADLNWKLIFMLPDKGTVTPENFAVVENLASLRRSPIAFTKAIANPGLFEISARTSMGRLEQIGRINLYDAGHASLEINGSLTRFESENLVSWNSRVKSEVERGLLIIRDLSAVIQLSKNSALRPTSISIVPRGAIAESSDTFSLPELELGQVFPGVRAAVDTFVDLCTNTEERLRVGIHSSPRIALCGEARDSINLVVRDIQSRVLMNVQRVDLSPRDSGLLALLQPTIKNPFGDEFKDTKALVVLSGIEELFSSRKGNEDGVSELVQDLSDCLRKHQGAVILDCKNVPDEIRHLFPNQAEVGSPSSDALSSYLRATIEKRFSVPASEMMDFRLAGKALHGLSFQQIEDLVEASAQERSAKGGPVLPDLNGLIKLAHNTAQFRASLSEPLY